MVIDPIRKKESSPSVVDMSSTAWGEEESMHQGNNHIYSICVAGIGA